jgi:hypothetical protein
VRPFHRHPGGLYLVELKGHPGRLVNRGATWQFHGKDHVRTITNPLHLTDLKSKELKARLQAAAQRSGVPGCRSRGSEPESQLDNAAIVLCEPQRFESP